MSCEYGIWFHTQVVFSIKLQKSAKFSFLMQIKTILKFKFIDYFFIYITQAGHPQQQNHFDKFNFFPHIPDSPDHNHHKRRTAHSPIPTSHTSGIQKQQRPPSLPQSHTLVNHTSVQHTSENFYEFFFSHLPIIEYQFKELREKIINYLPLHFNPAIVANSARNNSFSSTNSASSSQIALNMATDDASSNNINTINNSTNNAAASYNSSLKLFYQQNFIQQILMVGKRIK